MGELTIAAFAARGTAAQFRLMSALEDDPVAGAIANAFYDFATALENMDGGDG